MHYNTIHKEYRLGLGLYFKLIYDHHMHPGGWLCLSNIPALDYKKLEATCKETAVLEVMLEIKTNLDLTLNK